MVQTKQQVRERIRETRRRRGVAHFPGAGGEWQEGLGAVVGEIVL